MIVTASFMSNNFLFSCWSTGLRSRNPQLSLQTTIRRRSKVAVLTEQVSDRYSRVTTRLKTMCLAPRKIEES